MKIMVFPHGTTIRRSGLLKTILWALGALCALPVAALAVAMALYSPRYVFRVLVWQESDSFDWRKFPARELRPDAVAAVFAEKPDDRVPILFQQLAGVSDWQAFLEDTGTQAFIVLAEGAVIYERYANDTRRDSIVTSFSVAKSFTSALIGIAIDEGFIGGVNDPITDYLPELAERDNRFTEITLRDLLMMASGLDYRAFRPFLFNGDDPLTTYYPDQRRISLDNIRIIAPPGRLFSYNKYHPQLLGMVLERSTGMPVTEYLQTRIWDPLGMEFGGSWSLDSERSGFEKMESGVNARAVDFAKFGQLYLNGGRWNGHQVISAEWIDESLTVDPDVHNPDYYAGAFGRTIYDSGRGYYKYMWYGFFREGGNDFAARGDRGQIIYVALRRNLVIVRNGIEYGPPFGEWVALFQAFAAGFRYGD